MKKALAFILLIVLSFGMVACSGDEYTQIGTSDFSIMLPKGYKATEDDFEEDQIAYYFKDDKSVDFDIYQWDKEGKYTLKEEAEYFASQYNAVAEEFEVNGICGMRYVSKESFDGDEYTVVNFMFEDNKSIIELSFWTVDIEKEYKVVSDIVSSIKKN